ncbi:D(2) dopamine receptor [Elysia marginata]|uniref:D(2) dopamine receptor n=1 Tax=Elysia marginata TaxID=1093978 RepID=A0AAV4GWS1_9GAST|nr:D(2) dopamine receptor [Elysia marginata]
MSNTALANSTDHIDQQEFIDSVGASFFTWLFKSLLPRLILGLFLLLLTVGVVTNAVLVGVAISSKLVKHLVHNFLLQLCVLDILACFLVVLPILVNVAHEQASGSDGVWAKEGNASSKGFCKVHAVLFNWFLLVNFVLHDAMIIERALHATTAGKKYHLSSFGNRCFVRLLSTGIWTITLLVALVLTVSSGDDLSYSRSQHHCALNFHEHPGTMHALFSLTVYCSLAVFVASMFVIFCTRRGKIRNQQTNAAANESKSKCTDKRYTPSFTNSMQREKVELQSTKSEDCDDGDPTLKSQYMHTASNTRSADLISSLRQYKFSRHTEETGDNKTSVFCVEMVRPDILLRPIMEPLHRSNVRVGALPDYKNPVEKSADRKSTVAPDFLNLKDLSLETSMLKHSTSKREKTVLPSFRSKQLWIKAKGLVTTRATPLSLFRDVPHDVHHHLSMTYFISWAVTYLLWVLYVISAFTEVYGGVTCHACYRVGVPLGLSTYSVRPLVLVGHNRWYREQCRQELKRWRSWVRKHCTCAD